MAETLGRSSRSARWLDRLAVAGRAGERCERVTPALGLGLAPPAPAVERQNGAAEEAAHDHAARTPQPRAARHWTLR
jgi:hypothetical protein